MRYSLINFRSSIFGWLPSWAQGPNLFRLLYTFALIFDELYDWFMAAVNLHFPGRYSYEANARHGRARRLTQGPAETDADFVVRLEQWWDKGKREGHSITLAQQVQEYLAPYRPRVDVVWNDGTRWILSYDGTWTVDTVAWNWDNHPERVSRFWVVVYPYGMAWALGPAGAWEQVGSASTYVLDENRLVGCDTRYLDRAEIDVLDYEALHQIIERERAPHTCHDSLIMILDAGAFWATPPDGTWQYWANRNTSALYGKGSL